MSGPGVDHTRVGHFLGPHGVQGGIKLYVLGSPEQVLKLPRVYVEDRGWLRVRRAEPLVPGVALHLAGITSREGAETLRGLNVYAADSDLPAPEEGVYYYHELRGLPVRDESGTPLGEVVDVEDSGHQDLLVVRHEGGDSFVPLQAPYVQVNLEGRQPVSLTLTAETPAGLLGDDEEAESDDDAANQGNPKDLEK
ncbi:ribosome maturation factor RimM [Deinococcus deserti]|uniref:Ribosome maturation factor RimM n=1 Tax=Deinococcus deserti (strain DSM 17065 / CIP 109153 / LMG 22923 / VCD115) TaxID=546414 RepID=C1CUT9_DEIDV|nr:ribosome maturation factor RimM [Deinococcus deserti]ACO45956.1 putative 16S rRNA-processing protein RimM [Deinococcus deserti VCD115]